MEQTGKGKNECKIKCFFSRLFDKIDKKLQEKAKNNRCCSSRGKSCCK